MALIDKVQIYSVVQQPPEYSWSPVMPEVLNTDTIVKLTDEHGHVGVGSVCTFTEYGVDKSVLGKSPVPQVGLRDPSPSFLGPRTSAGTIMHPATPIPFVSRPLASSPRSGLSPASLPK